MKRISIVFMILIFVFSCSQSTMIAKKDELIILARDFVSQLSKKEYSSAANGFNSAMKQALPDDKLEEIWSSLIFKLGQFKNQERYRTQAISQYEVVFVTCVFEKDYLDVKVVFDNSGKIAGLYFLPVKSTDGQESLDLIIHDAFIEKEVVVGSGKWSLPGTLSLPRGTGPFPGLVLVHGSGPQDRDETMGPNKPFRDLAWALAKKGIAVLRYEKRTKHYAAEMGEMSDEITVEEETVADAVKAIDHISNNEAIDKKRIFVLGHSLGGMLIPKIGLRHEKISGLIIMAGASRPLEDIIYEQFKYIFSLDGQITNDEQRQLNDLSTQVQRVKSTKLIKGISPKDLPLGIPASYWIDLKNYDPVKTALKLTDPILILQGARDYQVTLADFERWQDALSNHDNVTFKLYPALNHLFITGEGKSRPMEYDIAGHVDQTAIEDLSTWILMQGK